MFQSSNPVLTRDESFSPKRTGYDANGSDPTSGQLGPMGGQVYGQPVTPPEARMTIEDVATKFAVIMGLLVLTAAASWMLLPNWLLYPAMIGAGLLSLVAVVVVCFMKSVSPVAVLAYAAIEGVFIGGFSKIFEYTYPGIVIQAVLGTFVTAAVVFAAYRFFNLAQYVNRFRKIIIVATVAFAAAMLLNFVLYMFGIDMGLRAGVTGPVGPLAIVASAIGVVLAAINLVLDFEFIENGVRNGAPAKQSWMGAFGLAVTMVWLYTEILRILSYLRR